MKMEKPVVKSRSDAVMGFVLLLFSVWYALGALSLPKVHLDEVIEPNVYPLVLAVVLALLSLFLLLKSFRAQQNGLKNWLPPKEIARQIIFLFAALAAYILLFRTLGYFTSTFLFMVGTLKFIDRNRSLANVILLSLLVSGISYALFIVLFQIPVPRGILM